MSWKNNLGNFINSFYISLWLIPLTIFMLDFIELDNLFKVFEYKTLKIFYYSFFQALLSTIFCFIISILPSIYISKKENILSSLIENSIFIPFFFPPISVIVVFSIIFFNFEFINNLNIHYSLKAIIIAHVFYNSPIFIKYIGSSLRKIPDEIEEAAKIETNCKRKIFYYVNIPIIMSSILKAAFMVFVFCFTSFAVVLSLGELKYSTFEVAIINSLLTEFDFSKAFGYSIIQLSFLILLNSIIGKVRNYELGVEKVKIEKVTLLTFLFSFTYLIFEYMIVLIGIFASIFNFNKSQLDFSGAINILSKDFNNKIPVIESIINSILISIFVSILVTTFTYVLIKNKNKVSDIIILSSLGISSAFISLCFIYQNIIFGVPLILLVFIGLFFINVPISYSFMYQHIVGFPKSILESAKIDGSNVVSRFFLIELPILFPILISSILQNFAVIYGEFTFLYAMQIDEVFPVASVINYKLVSKRLFMESSAMSTINLLVIFSVFALSRYFIKRFHIKD